MSIRTIEQSVSSGNHFDGTTPAGDPVLGDDLEAFPIGTAGGLFDFGLTRPTLVHQILVKLGGQANFTLTVIDRNGVEIDLVALTGSELFFRSGLNSGDQASNLILFEKEKLKIVTSGGAPTNDFIAKVSVDPYRS